MQGQQNESQLSDYPRQQPINGEGSMGDIHSSTKNINPQPATSSETNEIAAPFTFDFEQHKLIVVNIVIVALGLVCIALSVVAITGSNDFFSKLFSFTDEATGKEYLGGNFSCKKLFKLGALATVYLSMMGAALAVSACILHFAGFSPREGILGIHALFYFTLILCGPIAMDKTQALQKSLEDTYGSTSCSQSDYKCQITPLLPTFRGKLATFLIGYCILYPIFAAALQIGARWQFQHLEAQRKKKYEQKRLLERKQKSKRSPSQQRSRKPIKKYQQSAVYIPQINEPKGEIGQ